MKSERPTAPLTEAEKNELLALAGSTELRTELRSTVENREISFDDYIAFATSVARLSNHAPPALPPSERQPVQAITCSLNPRLTLLMN